MNPFEAYKRHQTHSMPRIEVILGLYRKAFENLAKARQALTEQNRDAAQSFLLKTQLIVTSLSADLPAYRDETAVNFLRLYGFVAQQMAHGTIESIDAAAAVLRPLMEGFETVRGEALALETQGTIPPLAQIREISLNA